MRRYEADAERRERFFFSALGGGGEAPATCTPDIIRAVTHQHLASPCVWAVFPLQVRMGLTMAHRRLCRLFPYFYCVKGFKGCEPHMTP